jgi:hypothetical protein
MGLAVLQQSTPLLPCTLLHCSAIPAIFTSLQAANSAHSPVADDYQHVFVVVSRGNKHAEKW